MIHRLVSVPLSNINFTNELSIIKQIAANNGYDSDLINKILNKKQKQISTNKFLYNGTPSISNNMPNYHWRRILFISNFSNLSVRNLPLDIKPAFYTNNNLGKFLINTKDKEDKLSHSGIYKLSCSDCPAFYIGKTARNVNIRVKEHLRCLNGKGFSELANHLISSDHNFNKITGTSLLHKNSIGIKLDNLESLEIRKSLNTNMSEYLLNNQINLSNQKNTLYSPIFNLFPKIHSTP